MYFKSKNLESLLEDEKQAEMNDQSEDRNFNVRAQIGVENRRKIVRTVVDFMVENFGIKPTAYQKISTAKATIMLFPRLEFKNSKIGGIVSDRIMRIRFNLLK